MSSWHWNRGKIKGDGGKKERKKRGGSQLVHAEVVSWWIGGVVRSHKLLGKLQPGVLSDLNGTIVGELVESHAGFVFGDVPELLESDELVSVDFTVAILIGVGEGGFEESLQVLWNGSWGGDLGSYTSGPVGELSAVDLSIVINIGVIHQKLEDLLLVADGLIVEVVTRTDVSGSRQLGHHSLVVLEVDHAVAVDVVSELEQKFKFLLKEVTHLYG